MSAKVAWPGRSPLARLTWRARVKWVGISRHPRVTRLLATALALRVILRPFALARDAHEETELVRFAWWLRRIYPTQRNGSDEITRIGTERLGFGVRLVPPLFRMRYATVPVSDDTPYYMIEIGAFYGTAVYSTYGIERMRAKPWERTLYDEDPTDVAARHARVIEHTVRRVWRSPAPTRRGNLLRCVFLMLTWRVGNAK